jgi:hypothetical protein
MSFWKTLLVDISFVTLYYVMWKIMGFELTVIIALAQVMGAIVMQEEHKKPKPPVQTKTVYVPQKRKIQL